MAMPEFTLRQGTDSDIPELKALWRSVFGDPDANIDAFLESFFSDSLCVAADIGNTVGAMGFLLPAGFLRVPDKNDMPCAIIYAVATKPSMRKLGLGGVITRALLDAAAKRGIEAVALHPAENSLFAFYERKAGFKTTFNCSEQRISIKPGDESVRRVSAAEYMAVRGKLLWNTPHITFDERAFKYQERLCGEGGLFVADGELCCAIVEAADNEVRIIELLGGGEKLLHGIAQKFPAQEYFVRCPGSDIRFGMLNAEIMAHNAWFGPAFD